MHNVVIGYIVSNIEWSLLLNFMWIRILNRETFSVSFADIKQK